MSDYNNYVFGMTCDKVEQIQYCLVYSVAKLTDFLPNDLDTEETKMTDCYIQALAKYAQKPSSLTQECPICLLPGHPFEECEVLGNYKFLKAHMRELSLLWKRLRMMIKRHAEKKEANKQKRNCMHYKPNNIHHHYNPIQLMMIIVLLAVICYKVYLHLFH